MPRALAPVLTAADLPWAELQAARLDGDLYDLGDGFCLVGELEGPPHRARAVLADRSRRLIAESTTAAWIWGAHPHPARLRFAVSPAARARLSPATGIVVREIVHAPGDLTTLDEVFRVTTPMRTALDLARDDELDDDERTATVTRLAAIAGFDLDEAMAALRGRAGIPSRGTAEARLKRAWTTRP
jgi:hypothetical protein